MNIGFTGTREGMSARQVGQLYLLLSHFAPGMLNTRKCAFHYGTHSETPLLADAQAASVAKAHGFLPISHYAESGGELERNKVIVAASDILIAAPLVDKEQLRSGTWATVRYARKKGIPVIMLSRGA